MSRSVGRASSGKIEFYWSERAKAWDVVFHTEPMGRRFTIAHRIESRVALDTIAQRLILKAIEREMHSWLEMPDETYGA